MRLPIRAVAAATAALLSVTVPVLAQDGTSTVSFDGVGFSFDRSIGTSANVEQLPGDPIQAAGMQPPDAARLVFALYTPRSEITKVPRPYEASSVVRVYRTADVSRYPDASKALERLSTLLAARPDLATYMAVDANGGGETLPDWPMSGAAQVFRARAQYIERPQLTGVGYVAGYRQDMYPFAAGDFWYLFQGLSTDGTWWVSATFVIDAGMFPRTVTPADGNRIARNTRTYARYLTQSIQTLNAADPNAFTPSLSSIDALLRSISFEGVPAAEPSPFPVKEPSPPSASPAG
jgi:hypothetical protein